MILREKYLQDLIRFQDTEMIKVVTGVRRSGKSTLLEMMAEHLAKEGVSRERILFFRVESMEFDSVRGDYRELYRVAAERMLGIEKPYLFFDEIQETPGWERAIESLRVDFGCDIYITGSNAFLLSSELSTLLTGRYVGTRVRPLTFSEYLDFKGAVPGEPDTARADIAMMPDGSPATLAGLFSQYRTYGGLPYLALSEPSREVHRAYCETLHNTVLVRDILERERRRGRRQVTNAALLERVNAFLADNIGNECSVNGIAGAIRSESLEAANNTVAAYVAALEEAYLFDSVRRYDIKGKELLKTRGKFYICDVGLRNYEQGYRNADPGRVLENIVYQQLVYEGYDVWVGHLRTGEVDFVASKDDGRIYIQVAEDMTAQATMERELAPLSAIRDGFPKIVVVGSGSYPTNIDGIKIVGAVDFLLGRR